MLFRGIRMRAILPLYMKPSVIVADLETVPDLGGFAAANDLVGQAMRISVRPSAVGSRSTP
jgi:hypothetical protein